MDHKIDFNQRQSSISLPKKNTPGHVQAVLTGWGQSSVNEPEPDILQKRNVSILTNEKCNEMSARMLDTHICGFDGKDTGFCNVRIFKNFA